MVTNQEIQAIRFSLTRKFWGGSIPSYTLGVAAARGHLWLVKHLLAKRAEGLELDISRALQWALWSCDQEQLQEIASLLLEAGATPAINLYDPLSCICRRLNADTLRKAIGNIDPATVPREAVHLCLISASAGGSQEVVEQVKKTWSHYIKV